MLLYLCSVSPGGQSAPGCVMLRQLTILIHILYYLDVKFVSFGYNFLIVTFPISEMDFLVTMTNQIK